jgi:hypothetical protein
MKSILIERAKGTYRVLVMDAEGRVLRKFTYSSRQRARTAARAWAPAHENCPIDDRTGTRTQVLRPSHGP